MCIHAINDRHNGLKDLSLIDGTIKIWPCWWNVHGHKQNFDMKEGGWNGGRGACNLQGHGESLMGRALNGEKLTTIGRRGWRERESRRSGSDTPAAYLYALIEPHTRCGHTRPFVHTHTHTHTHTHAHTHTHTHTNTHTHTHTTHTLWPRQWRRLEGWKRGWGGKWVYQSVCRFPCLVDTDNWASLDFPSFPPSLPPFQWPGLTHWCRIVTFYLLLIWLINSSF